MPEPLLDPALTPEHQEVFKPGSVAITTSTLYKNWYEGPLKDKADTDKIRGDLALETLNSAIKKGYHVVVIDSGSSQPFNEAAKKSGALYKIEIGEKSALSPSRQEALEIGKAIDEVKVLVTMEPEKSILIDSIPELINPLINNEADIVIPERGEKAMKTYPPKQAEEELKSNKLVNEVLRRAGLRTDADEDLDLWVGVRALRNEPKILEIFQRTHTFHPKNLPIDQYIDLERWSNALYLPIVNALFQGFKIKGVPVSYEHPQLQTENELDNPFTDRKREVQQREILTAMIEMVKLNLQQAGVKVRPSKISPLTSPV